MVVVVAIMGMVVVNTSFTGKLVLKSVIKPHVKPFGVHREAQAADHPDAGVGETVGGPCRACGGHGRGDHVLQQR